MIKVNLLPFKRKKKAKPLPTFLIASVILTVIICVIMAYLAFFFSTKLSEKKSRFAANERKIAELKEQIKAVDDFEQRNKMFKDRNDVIEQLREKQERSRENPERDSFPDTQGDMASEYVGVRNQ